MTGWLLIVVAGMTVFWIDLKDMAWLAWHDPESSHILLVPPLVVYLLTQRLKVFKSMRPALGWSGLLLVLGAVLIWEWGYQNDRRATGHLAVILLLIGASITFFGHTVARTGAATLGLLIFLLPIPGVIRIQMAVPLQELTAAVAEQVLVVGGVDVVRSGSVLNIGGKDVGVAEACNGMRMLFAVFLICYAYAVTTPMRTAARVVLALVSPLVALVCNVVRVVLTAWVYGWADESTAATFHDLSGWAIAGLAFGVIWGGVNAVQWLGFSVYREGPIVSRSPDQTHAPKPKQSQTGWFAGVACCGVVLAGGLMLGRHHLTPLDASDYHERIRAVAAKTPYEIAGYRGKSTEAPQAAIELLTPNVLLMRQYVDPVSRKGFGFLFVQCFDARDMMGHYPPNCYPSQGWELIGLEPLEATPVGDVAVYRFVRQQGLQTAYLTVAQAWMFPKAQETESFADLEMLNRAAGNLQTRHLGAAQWQVVKQGDVPAAELLSTFETMTPVIAELTDAVELPEVESETDPQQSGLRGIHPRLDLTLDDEKKPWRRPVSEDHRSVVGETKQSAVRNVQRQRQPVAKFHSVMHTGQGGLHLYLSGMAVEYRSPRPPYVPPVSDPFDPPARLTVARKTV